MGPVQMCPIFPRIGRAVRCTRKGTKELSTGYVEYGFEVPASYGINSVIYARLEQRKVQFTITTETYYLSVTESPPLARVLQHYGN